MLRGDLDAEIAFVVLQPDVIARLVLLDQVVFENERFFVVARDQGLDIFHPAKQELNLRALVRVIEIRPHPCAHVLGFAYINYLPGLVAHQIDAGPRR